MSIPTGMTPYYQDEHVILFHGDCREVLANMADQSVDAVITDPPYNIGKADWVDEGDDRDELDPDQERDRREAEAVEDEADRAYEAWLDRRWTS